MQQIIAEGNNIGEWENKIIIDINYLYAQAEDCLRKGNKMYKCDLLVEAFVYFLRMTRFYELIGKNSHLIISNRRHLNIRMNVTRIVSIMELIKPKLVKKYDKNKNMKEFPMVPYTGITVSSKLINSRKITTEESEYDTPEIKAKMMSDLDERWQRLVSKRIPKPESKAITGNQIDSSKEISKTTDNIDKSNKRLKYTNKDGIPLDALKILALHLQIYNRQIFDVPGDNNCQFHAVADQLERISIKGWCANKLRIKAVQWLKDNEKREMDDGKVGKQTYLKDAICVDNWDIYIEKMSKHDITWGDEATLLALSVLFKIKINVVSSLPGNYLHIVQPPKFWNIDIKGEIYIGHYHEFHYVSTILN